MMTWVEINKSNLENNLKKFRSLIGGSVLLIPVIKANAYGHGIMEIAKICDNFDDVDRLAVANLDEALLLKLVDIKKPIHVLSFFDNNISKISEGIKKGIIFPLYSLSQAQILNKIAERIGMKCVVHIKIDTGTSRVGFMPSELGEAIVELKKLKKLSIEGIWSHFSSSESSKTVTSSQNKTLVESIKILDKFDLKPDLIHIACTAASILYPNTRHDAVRVGLGIYGLYPDHKLLKKIKLEPVLSWKTSVIQLKNVKKGTKIGYGGTHTMSKDGKIAVLPVGYYDGYRREWGNKASVLVNGIKCPVIGRICMNLMMVDVSKVTNCEVGSAITLLGKENNLIVSADDLASLTPDTINYEIVTQINPLIPRIVV